MSQHTYTLKFTIKGTYEDLGPGIVHNPKPNLDQVMRGSETKEDLIKADVEEAIKKAIPRIVGAAQVVFDELTES